MCWKYFTESSCLSLKTLESGQSFTWKIQNNIYTNILQNQLISLKQLDNKIYFSTPNNQNHETAHSILYDYFRMNQDIDVLYSIWSNDSNFYKKSYGYKGVRMLRQDPWENLVSFICSSNNNIPRITLMIDRFCMKYGKRLGDYYTFPKLESVLHVELEMELREMGFGYRAKYINSIAKKELLSISGVGPKVADCICLMSLDKLQAIPVDTHVLQIALRDYDFKMKTKSLTEKSYNLIGDMFRDMFGDYAGWAHTVLFTADLNYNDQKDENKNDQKDEKNDDLEE